MSEDFAQHSNQQTIDLISQQVAESATGEYCTSPKQLFRCDETVVARSFGRRGLRTDEASWIL